MSFSPEQLDRIGREHAAEIGELASFASTREAVDGGGCALLDEACQAAIEAGLIEPQALEACRDERRRLAEQGQWVSLAQLLFRRGQLTMRMLMAALAGGGRSLGQVGRYELIREVARGGMGVVFEAIDPQLRRRVAVKLLRSVDARPAAVARFRREAAIAAQLRHPNIVVVHEVGEAPDPTGLGAHFIAMEFVDGVTLEDLLRDPEPDRDALLGMLAAVAEAAAYAHGEGVVHRDLKPANVLVEQPGGRVVLGDFGLATWELVGTRLTRTNARMGTPHYMAPEQVAGDGEAVGPATDVYALGVILYRVLSGRLPFDGERPEALYAAIERGQPRPLSGVERPLAAICAKALERRPAQRYPDAGAFAADLRRQLAGEPVQARPPGRLRRLRELLARRWQPLVAALLVLALAGWAARQAIDGQRQRQQDADQLAERERQRLAAERELARSRAQARAMGLLEQGRPALNQAALYRYDADASMADLRALVDRGLARVEQAIAIAPELAVAHYLRGRGWELKGYPRRAEASWREAIRLDPGCGPAHLGLAHLLAGRAFIDSWKLSDRVVVERARREADQVLAAIDAAQRSGMAFDDELQREATRALELCVDRSDMPELHRVVTRAIARYEGKRGVEQFHLYRVSTLRNQEALASLERALAIRPKYFLALYFLGTVRLNLACASYDAGQREQALVLFAEAADALDRALQIRPTDAAALDMRARVRYLEGWRLMRAGQRPRALARYRQALDDYGLALRHEPDRVESYRYRALVRQYADVELEAAVGDFDAIIRLRPRDVGAHAGRAFLLARLGDLPRAIAGLRRALEVAPADARNRPHLEAALRRYQAELEGR